jgi:sulfite reductase (NADPH) hemoprotein beta-component
VTVGGGLGATHGDPETYPRIASVIGFVLPEQVIEVAEAVVTTSVTSATAPCASSRG